MVTKGSKAIFFLSRLSAKKKKKRKKKSKGRWLTEPSSTDTSATEANVTCSVEEISEDFRRKGGVTFDRFSFSRNSVTSRETERARVHAFIWTLTRVCVCVSGTHVKQWLSMGTSETENSVCDRLKMGCDICGRW